MRENHTPTLESGFLPILPFRHHVLYPGRILPVNLTSKKAMAVMEEAMARDNQVLIITQRTDLDKDEATSDSIYRTGVLGRFSDIRGDRKKGYQAMLSADSRIVVAEFHDHPEVLMASWRLVDDIQDCQDSTEQVLLKSLRDLAAETVKMLPGELKGALELLDKIDDLPTLIYLCAEHIEGPITEKQKILETLGVKERTLLTLDLLFKTKETLKIQFDLKNRLNEKIGRQQRDAILREQLSAIKKELGDSDKKKKSYSEKIQEANLPPDILEAAMEEAEKLEGSSMNQSAESATIRGFLDLVLALPWTKSSEEQLDLDAARTQLDNDHYGVEKIKKRIVQHLAVLKLKGNMRGSIILLLGPPGVGKTSFGESIAKAMGRKFVRVSLGGVRDDAEIRGHRRTYVGAMPGKIVSGLKRAGVNNPVMLLDEIDKLGRSLHGDPGAALLEVLDPEQNHQFMDHYLDLPVDLSKVMFIATANSLEGISGPLLDRCELIELSSYTSDEKIHIAERHLLPKLQDEYGIPSEKMTLDFNNLRTIIDHYTREAGVRNLNRMMSQVMRHIAEELARNSDQHIVVDDKKVHEYLGVEKYHHEKSLTRLTPGVVTGLAWTPVGGDVLFIEASQMSGSGKLTLTGQLGDVMKESAYIGLSLVRSYLAYSLEKFEFDKRDIHVHVPSGAIPKDGPSAGVTMFTALAAMALGKSVSTDLAMTGEITLRGSVEPVGGVKEKVLAAHRAGITKILLSEKNRKDVLEIPDEVREVMHFEYVNDIKEVIKYIFGIELISFDFHPQVTRLSSQVL